MRLNDCHNHHDFRRLAQRRLPGPIFNYIDGAADDETTCRRKRFRLPQLEEHGDMGQGAMSIGRYFSDMLDPSMNWDDVSRMVQDWGGPFCLKGVMSAEDARHAADIGCAGVVMA